MAEDGTGVSWNATLPAQTDQRRYGAQEIRGLRKGVEIRLAKEHVTPAAASVGGEHVSGSAQGWYQSGTPTTTPGGATLTTTHAGRLWFNSGNRQLSIWGGSGFVNIKVNSAADIADNIITTAKLVDNIISTVKITDGNVTTAKIADANITTAKLVDASVTTAKIADLNVTTNKIADANVTTIKIADSNVTTAKIANLNVTSGKIADLNISTGKLADAAVTTDKVANLAITTAKINLGAVTQACLQDNAVDGFKLANDTVYHEKVIINTIGADRMKDGSRTGNGVYIGNGSGSGPSVTLPFGAAAVIVLTLAGDIFFCPISTTTAISMAAGANISTAFVISGTTFTITTANSRLNQLSTNYRFLCFG